MRKATCLSLILLCSIYPSLVNCAVVDGKVIGVADGDTLTVLRDHDQIKVRLAEIDAPEKSQPFGKRSKQSLSELCFGKQARIEDKKHSQFKRSYERIIGRVYCDEVDVNAEQVRRGMAWTYDQYVTDPSMYAIQNMARSAKIGLWSDTNPTPPWKWRHIKKASWTGLAK